MKGMIIIDAPGFFQSLLLSVLVSVLAENFVFARAFGVSTMIIAAKNNRNLPGICLGVLYFTLTASAAACLLKGTGLAENTGKPFIPLMYVLTIGVVYLATLLLAFVFFRKKFGRFKKYVHISAFNSAVMGTIFLSIKNCSGIFEFLLFGLCSGIGFAAAAYMLSGVYGRLYSKDVPSSFRGYPAVMIFTGIIAMALYGVLGHIPSYA